MEETSYKDSIRRVLYEAGSISFKEHENFYSRFKFEKIFADGSQRNFIRIRHKDKSIGIAVFPGTPGEIELAESYSTVHIGTHLYDKGVPVPQIVGSDLNLGIVVFEDCGDTRLYDQLAEKRDSSKSAEFDDHSIYNGILDLLIHMQIEGADGFDANWCYDTSSYNRDVMIKRESLYFLHSFWYDFLDGDKCPEVHEEFEDIARQASIGLDSFFLHRDFQCRNIMIDNGSARLIDFQAGRLGPPGYDLASLLIDPYSNLSEEFRETLLSVYIEKFAAYKTIDIPLFCRQFIFLQLQRNLQILGAYSYLFKNQKKPFFKKYIYPSLHMLKQSMSKPELKHYVKLKEMVDKASERIEKVL